jgi:8-oxo-dGTP pyrophosphatase MutT (NUDIX family)
VTGRGARIQLSRLRDRLKETQPVHAEPGLLRWAAVALILSPSPDSILLIRRAERRGDPWGGHMALPGGRRAPDDADLLTTAIRETNEEVGILLQRADCAGTVEDVTPQTPVLPPIAIRPFVFIVPERPILDLNVEVAAAAWYTLDRLLAPQTHHLVQVDVGGSLRSVPAYQLDDAIVWGLTERILTDLVVRFREEGEAGG